MTIIIKALKPLYHLKGCLKIAFQAAAVSFLEALRFNHDLDFILGYTDSLTQLPNRKAFERDKAKFHGGLSLIFIDIDDFKRVNDTHGHAFGDRVLRDMAQCIKAQVNGHSRAYRYGGDEFLLVAPRPCVEGLCQALQCDLRRRASVTISQGVVLDPGAQINDDDLHLADLALYESKQRGKDRITTAVPVTT